MTPSKKTKNNKSKGWSCLTENMFGEIGKDLKKDEFDLYTARNLNDPSDNKELYIYRSPYLQTKINTISLALDSQGQALAIKTKLPKKNRSKIDKTDLESLHNEFQSQSSCPKTHVLSLLGLFEISSTKDGTSQIGIISPFLDPEICPPLNVYIRHRKIRILELLEIGRHLAVVIEALFKAKIYHSDIKTNQFFLFLDKNTQKIKKAIITDFGHAISEAEQQKHLPRKLFSSPTFIDPKLVVDMYQEVPIFRTKASETYSFAVTLWSILTSKPIYNEKNYNSVFKYKGLNERHRKILNDMDLDHKYFDFFTQVLNNDPQKRTAASPSEVIDLLESFYKRVDL